MAFSPTITNDSKAVPGARYTVKRMGFARRIEVDLKTLSLRQRLRELEVDNPSDTPREQELQEQLAIARMKAVKVPEDQVDGVIQADIVPLILELRNAADPATKKQRAVLHEEYLCVESRMRQEWIRAGFVSIEGSEFDGLTVEQLLEYGPPELTAEIYQAIVSDGKLSGAERKNSFSPITSGALVGGENTSSIAPNAVLPPSGITAAETASDTSPRP